ncbi:PREDICTED: uncharacterized protein LOC109467604 [Branchiostoma belcheri]|uniref:Uncharacterized protein LOC109467604 n=1 Tax=Branchiostoma belcheri TaxID=7741 RepID=A0A6P4YVA6_BRABE|nr:PREDICTED: uncharacterized protein LOC109467604 [Branchiostoma belcheri]
MNVFASISLSEQLLPPQLLYQGKTDACHPKFSFPSEWDIYHSESHCSNVDTMHWYADTILIPYMEAQREALGLDAEQPGLAIFDVFKAHRNQALLEKLKQHNILAVFVPASCTGELQPLDCDGGVNYVLKKELRQRFITYYAESFTAEHREDRDLESVTVDLKLSKMKCWEQWTVSRTTQSPSSGAGSEQESVQRWTRAGCKFFFS